MENIEEWKDIPEYVGIYQASTFGRIRTCENKTTETQMHRIRHWKQRILRPKGQTYKTGYRVTLWKNGKPKDWLVARLCAITFLGKSNLTVNHIDGNRFNNHIENLEWCSLADNIRKGFETGLYKFQKKIMLTNKATNECIVFRALSLASKYLKKNRSYLSSKIKKQQFENEEFKWGLVI